MADIRAAQNGNWSATSTWTGGVVPTAADTAFTNNFTVQLDVANAQCLRVTNEAGSGAVAGGSINLLNGSHLTCTQEVYPGASNLITFDLAAGQSATLTGPLWSGSRTTNSVRCISIADNAVDGGTLTINGNLAASPAANSGASREGLVFARTVTLVINGDIVCLNRNTSASALTTSTANAEYSSITVNGNVVGGAVNASAIQLNRTGMTMVVNGNVSSNTGGSSGNAITLGANATSLTVNGSIVSNGLISASSSAVAIGISTSSTTGITCTVTGDVNPGLNCRGIVNGNGTTICTINIGGSVYGGGGLSVLQVGGNNSTCTVTGNVVGCDTVGATGHAAELSGTGTLNIVGDAIAGEMGTSHGVHVTGLGTLTCRYAVGNDYGTGNVGGGVSYGINATVLAACTVKGIRFGSRGASPVFGNIFFVADTANNLCEYRTSGFVAGSLVHPDTTGELPLVADVRDGTVYGVGGNLTGTLAVPDPAQVALGVATDNTVGTAVLTNTQLATSLASIVGAQVAALA